MKSQLFTVEQEEKISEIVVNSLNLSEKQNLIIIENLPHSNVQQIIEKLHGKYENLFISSTDGEVNFFGNPVVSQTIATEFKEFGGLNGTNFQAKNCSDKVQQYILAEVMIGACPIGNSKKAEIDCNNVKQLKKPE